MVICALGVAVTMHFQLMWPDRLWLLMSADSEGRLAAGSVPDAPTHTLVPVGHDQEVFEVTEEPGWLPSLARTAGLRSRSPEYWATSIQVTLGSGRWVEVVRDGRMDFPVPGGARIAGTWRHSPASGGAAEFRFGTDSTLVVSGDDQHWRWALAGDTLVAAPSPSTEEPMTYERRMRLRRCASWALRFQANVSPDRRSYDGVTGPGGAVHGTRTEVEAGR